MLSSYRNVKPDCGLVISFLGSSLNAVVVFSLEVTHAARFALKTTSAFNGEPKNENLASKVEEIGRIGAASTQFLGKNRSILAHFCSQSTKFDVCVSEITRRRAFNDTERNG